MIRRGGLRGLNLLALPLALILLWLLVSAGSTNFYFPPLTDIVDTFGETWLHGRLTADVLPSLVRLLIGYLLALGLGVSAGLAIGSSNPLRRLLEPVLEFLRAIPPPVLVPILILFAGVDNKMKVLVIISGCLWPILLNTIDGVRGIDPVLRDTARVYRLGRRRRTVHLVLRGASPRIATGARQALSIGIILMVISEMTAASNGLGFAIVQFQRGFAIPEMWSGILLLGVIGVLLSLIFQVVEGRALAWYHGARRAENKG
jgi:ABC-type nitrate/sulfonate/bicarbonate transport system permease component